MHQCPLFCFGLILWKRYGLDEYMATDWLILWISYNISIRFWFSKKPTGNTDILFLFNLISVSLVKATHSSLVSLDIWFVFKFLNKKQKQIINQLVTIPLFVVLNTTKPLKNTCLLQSQVRQQKPFDKLHKDYKYW